MKGDYKKSIKQIVGIICLMSISFGCVKTIHAEDAVVPEDDVTISDGTSDTTATDIVSCDSDTQCTVKVYKSELPKIFSTVTIGISPTGETIPADNSVTFTINGASFPVICDGLYHDVDGAVPFLNQLSCTVATDRKSTDVRLVLNDQNSYVNLYTSDPAIANPELSGTSIGSQSCIQETSTTPAEACKWEESRGASSWAVLCKTVVSKITLYYSKPPTPTDTVPTNFCGSDKNGDGNITSDEAGACVTATDSSLLCLMDAAKCQPQLETPICPAGSTLNPDSDQCEAPATYECPTGFVYDATLKTCTMAPDCPNGGVFNSTTDKCELIISGSCPTGYAYDTSQNLCLKAPICSYGAYDPGTNKCVIAVSYECQAGYTLNGTICTMAPACPVGAYNSVTNQCQYAATYQCSLGGTYSTSGTCASSCTSTSYSCGSGYSLNGTTCQAAPVCSGGSTYNVTTDRCELSMNYQCSRTGEIFSSLAGCNTSCIQTGTCTQNYCYYGKTGHTGHANGICGRYDNECDSVAGTTCARLGMGAWSAITGTLSPGAAGEAFLNYFYGAYDWDGDGITFPMCSCSSVEDCHAKYYSEGGGSMCETNYDALYAVAFIQSSTCSLTGASYTTPSACSSSCTVGSCSATCPTGFTNSGGICIVNATCPSGGALNPATNRCEYAGTVNTTIGACVAQCSSGTGFTLSGSVCSKAAECSSGGVLDGNTDQCSAIASAECPSGYTLNGSNCTSDILPCSSGGFFDVSLGKCKIEATALCPSGYAFDTVTETCSNVPTCYAGSTLNTSVDKCNVLPTYICQPGTSYSIAGDNCAAYPMCLNGAYDAALNGCNTGITCPYGPAYTCKEYNGEQYCSQKECKSITDAATISDNQGENDLADDGEKDAEGNCLGIIRIFNGKDDRCRSDGMTIAFANCCTDKDYMMGLGQCTPEEISFAQLRAVGLCHYVGKYCSKKMSLGVTTVCIEHKKTYCCFNSKLGRILQEQGRPQLKTFSGWGTPKAPECRGFTMEEFGSINFEQVDMSEWFGDIQTKAQDQIDKSVGTTINNYYDHL